MTTSVAKFSDFFREIWSYPPFPWQARLAERVRADGWPEVIDLPTGTGKSSVIDIAVWHMAVAAPGLAPRRVLFVVDRRIVVDSVHERAVSIQAVLERAKAGEKGLVAAASVARRLAELSGENGKPLEVAKLRGGMPRDPDWVRSPAQPIVATSTVDQVGSRLLFRGYGVPPSVRSIEAGLIGTDSIIFLDEAHLSEPFRQTLNGVSRLDELFAAERSIAPQRRSVVLSATPAESSTKSFPLLDSEWRGGALRGRLQASKLALLEEVTGNRQAVAKALVEHATALIGDGSGALRSCIVISNRVATARQVFESLRARVGEHADVFLVIGRSRDLDRERLSDRWLPLIKAGREKDEQLRSSERPIIVVATQCIEAGADLDVDSLVTESAPLDSLRQRFGRLDRLGIAPKYDGHRAVVVHWHRRDDDEIYGPAIKSTWEWILERAVTSGRGEAKVRRFDFGLVAMRKQLKGVNAAQMQPLVTPREDAPVIMPSYVEAWSETSSNGLCPTPALFLHGPQREADVAVVWRADITEADIEAAGNRRRSTAEGNSAGSRRGAFPSLAIIPPSSLESVTLSARIVRQWLSRGAAVDASDDSDVEDTRESDANDTSVRRARLVLRRDDRGAWAAIGPREIRPGDVLVVPASRGGADEWGWLGATEAAEPVHDVAEEAHRQQRGAWASRLHPAIPVEAAEAGPMQWSQIADVLETLHDDSAALTTALLSDGILRDGHVPADEVRLRWYNASSPSAGVILYMRRPRAFAAVIPRSTESDGVGAGVREVPLAVHLDHVEKWVKLFTGALDLPAEESRALELAARYHDLGKADGSFQAMLRGESRPTRFESRTLLAKSGNGWDPRAAERAGVPSGWRHEVLSVAMTEPMLMGEPEHIQDLVLWLIGTHHGRGRLVFNSTMPSSARVRLVQLESETIEGRPGVVPEHIIAAHCTRFDRLVGRYGHHQLAWLETLLRMGDHRASATNAGPDAQTGVSDE